MILAVLIGLVLIMPDISQANRGGGSSGGYRGGGYRGGHGQYHGGYRYYGGHRYHGGYRHWYGPRVWVGPAYPYPYYYYAPVAPPVYVGPPPAYAAPIPEQPQAYPDPAVTDQGLSNPPASPNDSGQSVTVPGQWVDGVWVDEHQVQIP